MDYFQQRRKALGLSQAELARRCGVTRQRISAIVQGRELAEESLAKSLELHLGTEGLPRQRQILPRSVLRRLNRPRPFDLPAVNQDGWHRMERHYRDQIDILGLEPAALLWMQTNFTADSGVEGVGLCSLAATGAERVWASPTESGYRGHGVVDRNGQPLGERLLPALYWKTSEFEVVFWPQLGLQNARGTFRVDLLSLIRVSGRTFWRPIEINGPLHREEQDEYRSRLLGVKPICIRDSLVRDLRLPELLRREILALGDAAHGEG